MFIIKREGLFLMNYIWIEDSTMPIGLWGKQICDAMVFDNRDEAERISERIGKCEIYKAQERKR